MTSFLSRIPLIKKLFPATPTPETVSLFWTYMSQRFNTKIVQKGNSAEMKAVAQFLDLIGVLNKDVFLTNYATTIGTNIYIPFTPGVAIRNWDLFSQIRVCAHEHQHVIQYKRTGAVPFAWDYVTNTARRTMFEVEAYRTGMELTWRYLRQIQSAKALAAGLKNYGCNANDVQVAEKALLLAIPTIKAGGLTTEAGIAAAEWLDKKL